MNNEDDNIQFEQMPDLDWSWGSKHEARVSRGNKAYKHQFSDPFNSGFRIKAYAGIQLSKQDTINIGKVILANDILVKRLVVLGFDTLEVHSDVGSHGCQWQLHDFIMIGQGGQNNE